MKLVLVTVPLMDWIEGELHPIAMDRVRTSPPLGMYWLAAVAREAGHEVEIVDLIAAGKLDLARVVDAAGRGDACGVSANSLNWPSARMVINHVKERYPDMPVIAGGIHPTAYPDHVAATSAADFLVMGEGEQPLLLLLDALAGKGRIEAVPGLCWRGPDGLLRNPMVSTLSIGQLEALPDPAYDLLPPGVYESLSVESARGCRFNCTFCSTKFRGSWRGIGAACFVDRVERLRPYLDRCLYPIFSFVDDLYTLDVGRTVAITNLFRERGLDVQATLDARATDVVRPGLVEALAPITNQMLIGAECGYNEGLRRIRKGCTVEILERAARAVADAGIAERTVFSFVIGFPFETRDDCQRTIEFAAQLLLKHGVKIYLQWFNTIPGSALWNELADKGLVDIKAYDDFGFFVNSELFRAGVPLSMEDIQELSNIVTSLNSVFFLARPNKELLQFSAPEWLWAEPTCNFPSKGALVEPAG